MHIDIDKSPNGRYSLDNQRPLNTNNPGVLQRLNPGAHYNLVTHAWLVGCPNAVAPLFKPVPFLRPQQPTPHSLARWSPQFWQAANIADQGSIFWQLEAFLPAPLCRDVKFESLNGRNMVITALLELTGDLGKLTKLETKIANCNQMPALCHKFASWHGWYMVIAAPQLATKFPACVFLKLQNVFVSNCKMNLS